MAEVTDVLNNLAWILATDPDKTIRNESQALQLAQRACTLTDYKQATLLDTLAAAYASVGKFPQAVQTAQKALELAKSTQKKQTVDQVKQHLKQYKSNKPL